MAAGAFVYGRPRLEGSRLLLPYTSRADGDDVEFTEVVDFGEPLDLPGDSLLVQLLHAVAGLSYYKARPAPVTFDYDVDPDVLPFLGTVIEHGLAEYAHTTGRRDALQPTMTRACGTSSDSGGASRAESDGPPGPLPAEASRNAGPATPLRPLVPLGGGKDSVVSVDLIQRAGIPVHGFAVGDHPTIRACAAAADIPLTVVRRTLDPQLAAVTARTGLNGHIPVTAINSLVALVYAAAGGFTDVVMSNEASADEATLEMDGLVVNHQWSKSTAFEQLLPPLLPDGLRYFSLLRPLQEVAIAQRFAELRRYDDVAISCNQVYLRDPDRRHPTWCLRCAKCAFVGLILAPELGPERRTAMFHGDVLGSEAMSTYLRDLVGLTAGKPLECVGEVLESRAALDLLVQREVVPHFVAEVHRELVDGALLPTREQVERLFVIDPVARQRLPGPYRHLLDPQLRPVTM